MKLFRMWPMFLACAIICVLAANSEAAEQGRSEPWIAMARLIKPGEGPGFPGVYLGGGLIITAAHVVDPSIQMDVQIGGVAIPAKVLKQGSLEDVDLSLLFVDPAKVSVTAPPTPVCQAPPWPGDPVIVVDGTHATGSKIASPQILPFMSKHKFPTLIDNFPGTGNSGSGVFDPDRKCLLGIMSRKFTFEVEGEKKDLLKYFVPPDEVRAFIASAPKS